MKQTQKMKRLLARMAQIARMERGKLCRMGGRPHFNHQTWQDGRNVARYVPSEEIDFLQDAIDGYHQFVTLAEQYADEVIEQTRRERDKLFPKPKTTTKQKPSEKAQKPRGKKNES